MPLREIRSARRLSQAELARRAGVQQTTISKLEHGAIHDPSHRLVVRVCQALGVDPQMVSEFHVEAQ